VTYYFLFNRASARLKFPYRSLNVVFLEGEQCILVAVLKKLAAISLLTLFLFNIVGYRIFFFYAQQQSDRRLEVSLDKKEYNEEELITLKVPLSLPYQTDQAHFERVDGEITFKGKIYKYVKRKISGGNLVLLCLPDYNKMHLKKEKEDFFKDTNNLAENSSSKKQENSKASYKNFLSEYDQFETSFSTKLLVASSFHPFSIFDAALSSKHHSTPERPPEFHSL
jgi:hypothetical protein